MSGMNFGFSEGFKSIVNAFVRNEKAAGTNSANGPNKSSAANKGNAAATSKAADAFQMAAESLDAAGQVMQDAINYTEETMAACDWAADQNLAEAVDQFENPQVGNGLMIMSLLD